MAKCKACASGRAHTFKHGRSGYTNHGCRCETCSAANTEYMRNYAQVTWDDAEGPRCRHCANGEEHEFEHGMNGYNYHKCRCEICIAARYKYGKQFYQGKDDRRRVCKKCETGEPHTFIHGDSAYKYHSCRCEICVTAHSAYTKPGQKRWAKNLAEEIPGLRTGYEWTAEEDALVNNDDYTLRELAWQLDRSYNSVRVRRNDLRQGRRTYQCKKCATGEPHDFTHGPTGYKYHGCRCLTCRTADGEMQRRNRTKRKEAASCT